MFGIMDEKRTPILFLSDAVSCSSGLGRITRDLATRLHEHCGDMFDVASVGYGAAGSRKVPFKEYHLTSVDNWLVPELPEIYDDWCQGREGIIFCVWDASRLYWLGIPQTCPIPHLRKFTERKDVKKWLYGAIDAEGPNGKLSHRIAQTYKGFDRVIDYSAFSSKITGNPDHLPHGIDSTVFYPRPHAEARQKFIQNGFQGLTPDSLLIGIVATNQARKNWQLGMETCKILLDRGHDVRVWVQCDALDRYWSLGNLVVDYGLQGRVAITMSRFTDEQMAWMMSACDVNLSIGIGEGFGYFSAESLACGVPVVMSGYSCNPELFPKKMQCDPIAFYYEGAFCSKRPVYYASQWADRAEKIISMRTGESLLDPRLDWKNLWKEWDAWFRNGL